MASLAVTMKGELLAHLGVKSGERIELDKLPGTNCGQRGRSRPALSIPSSAGMRARWKNP